MWQKQFSATPEPEVPLYVVGDIHGRCDLLIRLVAMIDADAASRDIEKPTIIFVGDYVDRGPQSALVIAMLMELTNDPSRRVIALKGNHEVLLLKFLENPANGPRWLKNGGYETLLSYGIANITEDSPMDALTIASAQFAAAIGTNARNFLTNLSVSHLSGNVLVTHAGADPTVPIDKQDPKKLIWGPENFMKKKRKDKIWVAHGHYAEAVPTIENGRINVDTGAYFSNQLTAARILKDEIKFMTAEL